MADRKPSVFELQAGEGGEDSKLFVSDLARAYMKWAVRNNLAISIIAEAAGKISLEVRGATALACFSQEAGSHVVQRVPPTEKKGRRQTSIISVAVLPLTQNNSTALDMRDVEIVTKTGGGPGGQARNKTESMVVVFHKKSGIRVSIDSRSQKDNKRLALQILEARLKAQESETKASQNAAAKRAQVGNGGRGNKIRTYNFIENRATDHRSGNQTGQLDRLMKGHFELLT